VPGSLKKTSRIVYIIFGMANKQSYPLKWLLLCWMLIGWIHLFLSLKALYNRLNLITLNTYKTQQNEYSIFRMPTELFSQLGTNEKFTREVNFAHGCCDQYSVLQHYCTMYEGKRYITTLEQKEQAQKLYEINKQKAIKNVGNKLVFVGMGCEY
jgi:hypothetical protein